MKAGGSGVQGQTGLPQTIVSINSSKQTGKHKLTVTHRRTKDHPSGYQQETSGKCLYPLGRLSGPGNQIPPEFLYGEGIGLQHSTPVDLLRRKEPEPLRNAMTAEHQSWRLWFSRYTTSRIHSGQIQHSRVHPHPRSPQHSCFPFEGRKGNSGRLAGGRPGWEVWSPGAPLTGRKKQRKRERFRLQSASWFSSFIIRVALTSASSALVPPFPVGAPPPSPRFGNRHGA